MENKINDGKGLSVASLVLGIISAILAWFYLINVVAIICGIIGIILAAKGKKHATAANATTGLATAGLVLSIIGTCLAGIGFVSCTLCVAAASATSKAVADAASEAANEAAVEAADAMGAAAAEAANEFVDSFMKSLG